LHFPGKDSCNGTKVIDLGIWAISVYFEDSRNPTYLRARPSLRRSFLETRFRCPCCGFKTLEAPAALALCPICWWEDDGQEDADAAEVRLTVNGDLSLQEARQHFALCGAAHPRFLPYVRKPQLTEQ
jgi:hypothetical protein